MGSTRKQKKEDASVYSQWTPEQKFSIIMEYYNDRVPLSNLCRKHRLSPQLFSRWRDEFIETGKNLFLKQENPDSLLLREIDDYERLAAHTHTHSPFMQLFEHMPYLRFQNFPSPGTPGRVSGWQIFTGNSLLRQ